MSVAFNRIVDAALTKGLAIEEHSDHTMVQCPAHTDGRPSLALRPIEGSVLLYCFAGCETRDVVDALNLSMSDLFDDQQGFTYVYPGGRQVQRTPDKKFIQTGNKADKSLFHADKIKDGPVFVCEGEKDVLAIESIGGQAVSSPNGASAKPERYDWTPLKGMVVKVISDRDAPGRKRSKQLLEHLASMGIDAACCEPVVGKDAADHIAAGYSLNDFVSDTPEDVITLSDAFDSWREWRASEQAKPIPTPWPQLNSSLAGGLHPGRLYVVAARTGQGKSVVGQNIITHAVSLKHPSLVVSVEMPVVEVVSRILAAETRVDYSQITKREFGEHLVAIDSYIQKARSLPMFLCDNPTVTVEEIAERCRVLKETAGLQSAFVDYAQLIVASDKRVSREQQVAHIVRSMKLIAMELNIAVVLAAQLNRAGEQADRQPRISDLRESGELEQSADVILLLHQNAEDQSRTVVNVAKNRTGPPKSISLMRRFDQARLE